jgi:hypothetical protein
MLKSMLSDNTDLDYVGMVLTTRPLGSPSCCQYGTRRDGTIGLAVVAYAGVGRLITSRFPATRNRADDLRITKVFSCVVHGFKVGLSFGFTGYCW